MKNFQKLTEYLDSVVARGFAPCCDMTVLRDHEVLYRYMTGTTAVGGTRQISEDTLFYLYSCSKPITVAAAMQLYEAGKLDLCDPVSAYLPEYADAYVERDGKKHRIGDTMRIEHLFTMTAGLDYDIERPAVKKLIAEKPDASTREVVSSFCRDPLVFLPGEHFQYSLCHDVLGAVIEVASGMRFGEYLANMIFEPLGMQDTFFAKKGVVPDRLAEQYRQFGEGPLDPEDENKNVLVLTSEYESGGAGLISTTADYAIFADAMACGGIGKNGVRILKAETVELLRTPQMPRLGITDFGCAAGGNYSYGYGVRTLIGKEGGVRSPIGEFGWDGAAGAYILCDPVNRLSIVYLQHVQGWVAQLERHDPVRDLTYDALGIE